MSSSGLAANNAVQMRMSTPDRITRYVNHGNTPSPIARFARLNEGEDAGPMTLEELDELWDAWELAQAQASAKAVVEDVHSLPHHQAFASHDKVPVPHITASTLSTGLVDERQAVTPEDDLQFPKQQLIPSNREPLASQVDRSQAASFAEMAVDASPASAEQTSPSSETVPDQRAHVEDSIVRNKVSLAPILDHAELCEGQSPMNTEQEPNEPLSPHDSTHYDTPMEYPSDDKGEEELITSRHTIMDGIDVPASNTTTHDENGLVREALDHPTRTNPLDINSPTRLKSSIKGDASAVTMMPTTPLSLPLTPIAPLLGDVALVDQGEPMQTALVLPELDEAARLETHALHIDEDVRLELSNEVMEHVKAEDSCLTEPEMCRSIESREAKTEALDTKELDAGLNATDSDSTMVDELQEEALKADGTALNASEIYSGLTGPHNTEDDMTASVVAENTVTTLGKETVDTEKAEDEAQAKIAKEEPADEVKELDDLEKGLQAGQISQQPADDDMVELAGAADESDPEQGEEETSVDMDTTKAKNADDTAFVMDHLRDVRLSTIPEASPAALISRPKKYSIIGTRELQGLALTSTGEHQTLANPWQAKRVRTKTAPASLQTEAAIISAAETSPMPELPETETQNKTKTKSIPKPVVNQYKGKPKKTRAGKNKSRKKAGDDAEFKPESDPAESDKEHWTKSKKVKATVPANTRRQKAKRTVADTKIEEVEYKTAAVRSGRSKAHVDAGSEAKRQKVENTDDGPRVKSRMVVLPLGGKAKKHKLEDADDNADVKRVKLAGPANVPSPSVERAPDATKPTRSAQSVQTAASTRPRRSIGAA